MKSKSWEEFAMWAAVDEDDEESRELYEMAKGARQFEKNEADYFPEVEDACEALWTASPERYL